MKFLVSFVFVILLAIFLPKGQAQTPLTSQNIVTPTVGAWTGSVAGTNGGYSGGGSGPSFNATTNTLTFGYTTATTTQRMTAEAFAIQHALDLSNSGIKINGYNYSWQINNSGQQSGTLSGKVELLRNNTALETYIYNYNSPTNGFELKTGTQPFTSEYDMLAGDAMRLSFTGKDSRFWAGYYGPQVKEPSLTLNYTVDPCMANPLYSPSCPNFNKVLTSQNILGNEYGIQSYAINQALALSGSGVQINGFKYGYDLYVGGDWCYFGFIICFDWRQSSMAVDVNVTSSAGTNLYTATHNHTQQNTFGSYNYSYVFPTKQPLTSMGNFSLSPRQFGTGALYNSWSNWQYTPDPCTIDPLSSPSCPGYAELYKTQQCSINALFDVSCPGYAAAYFTQQCNANQLYNPACPGYAAAYLQQQCSINPLYSTTCAGYETAYFNQQCSINPLYNSRCEGYAVAYKTQQCNLDGLYARDCPNYNDAYARKYVIGIPSSGTISYGPADSRCTVGCDTSNTLNTNAGPATSGYSGPGATNVSTTQPVTSISNSGQISTGVAVTSDSNVNAAIATPRMDGPAASTGNSPVASSINSPGPAASGSSTQTANAGPATRQEQKSEDKRDDAPKGTGGNNSPQTTNTAQASSDKPAAPTARQAIQERREAAAKAEAVEKGKNLAGEMGKATNMQQQIAVQNVVIQAMGFTPGFDVYNKTVVPDGQMYKPYTAYANQRNVDNTRLSRGLFGATDKLHEEMTNQQYLKDSR